jgi:hypothetical protein
MKVERLLYGMQTANGKILTKYTDGVSSMLQPKSRDSIKALKPADSGKCKWFKTEQIIVYPIIIEVAVKDPSQGGRTWVQTQAFLTSLRDFIDYTAEGGNPFTVFNSNILPELELFPDQINPITV